MADNAGGWLLGVGSAIAFGSFGVPLKSPAVMATRIEPLMLQSYKTAMCFLTSWIALAFVPFDFTWWGTVGATVWIVTGTIAIVAIQNAGLGLAQAIWCGVSLLVSTWWGAFVFREPVKDPAAVALGLSIMCMGLAGVAYFARQADAPPGTLLVDGEVGVEVEVKPLRPGTDEELLGEGTSHAPDSKFAIGLVCAVITGVLAGSSSVPLKYANRTVTGISYMVSFGIGAAIANTVAAVGYFIGLRALGRPLPSFHVRKVGVPGCLAGVLWSVGSFLGVLCVESIGIAFANPLVTCQLVVGTAWGVALYGEGGSWRNKLGLLGASLIVLSGAVVVTRYGV